MVTSTWLMLVVVVRLLSLTDISLHGLESTGADLNFIKHLSKIKKRQMSDLQYLS